MPQNQYFLQSLIEMRSHYQSQIGDTERDSNHATEQLAHINALLVDQLVVNQQFTESLLQLLKHYQGLRSKHNQKVQNAKEQIAHVNALLADSLVLQHSQQQPISIQAANLEQQALMGAMLRADTRNATIANQSEESLQQNLEVAESPELPQVSEQQIPTDSHQVDPQPELEPPTELPDVEDSPNERSPSLSARQATLLKTPLLPQYEHLSKSEAVEKLLQENEGKVLHLNYIIRALHGELKPEDIAAEKSRMSDSLKKGIAKGLWDRVPDSPGYYTIDMKLVDSEAEQKKVEQRKPQRRKPNSKATEGMLPRYRGLTFTDAVESVMRDAEGGSLRDHRSGEVVTSDIMARALYGELEGQDFIEARNKIGKIMWSGASQGRWQSVPGRKGAYMLNLEK